MDRLNREFKTLTLNSVELDDDQLNQLVRIYLDNRDDGYRQKGAHYSIVGPFILPDSEQIMSKSLIIDRWLGLSAFKILCSKNKGRTISGESCLAMGG